MKTKVLPPKIDRLAHAALEKHSGEFDQVIEAVKGYDVIVDVPSMYAESLIAAAAIALRYCDGQALTFGYFSAPWYGRLAASDAAVCGFETFEDMMTSSDAMVISELSHVSAKIASVLDAYIYRRWQEDKRTILCGYNVPPKGTIHTAETIDGFSGYPLLASRLHRSVVYWSPKFFKATKLKEVK